MRLDLELGVDAELLAALADRAEDVRPALRDIADDFRERERRIFAAGGRPTWSPLEPDTVRIKGSSRVLVDTGGLLRSLTNRGDRYAVEKLTPDGLLVGTKNPVATLLRRGARDTPRRNPVPPTTAEERAGWADTLLAGLLGRA